MVSLLRIATWFAVLLLAAVSAVMPLIPVSHRGTTVYASGPTVSGAGSTWVQIALDQWRADIAHQGFLINYQGNGSSAGRSLYISGGIDFAASEIPFQPNELNQLTNTNPPRHWQYMPDVAGGTSVMYNLHAVDGSRITSLRLNADAVAKIFTGRITSWKDSEIAALNPGLQVRETRMIPVIRSDGSGTSAQLSLYLADQAAAIWNAFANGHGCPAPCSLWPPFNGSINANGSDSVANFVANDALGSGAVGYVEAGYAFGRGFPVASLLNASGNFVQPSSQNVSTALTHATLNADLSQNLTGVYRSPETNAYPMSSYSYMILPCVAPASVFASCSTTMPSNFDAAKGFVLGTWILYIACAGQREAAPLGYSPLPPNLIQADFNAVSRLPGHPPIPPLDYQHCPNPTLYHAGTGSTSGGPQAGGSSPPTAGSTAAGSASAEPSAAGGGVAPSTTGPGVGLPPGSTVVTVLGPASRARLLAAALTAAASTQPAPYTSLWIALLTVVWVVFAPIVFAMFLVRWRKSGE